MRDRLTGMGVQPLTSTPERFGEFRGVPANRANRSDTGDGDTPHGLLEGRRAGFRGDEFFYALAHLANGAHLADFVVRNVDVKLVLQGEKDFHRVHGIDVQLQKLAVDCNRFERYPLRCRDHC